MVEGGQRQLVVVFGQRPDAVEVWDGGPPRPERPFLWKSTAPVCQQPIDVVLIGVRRIAIHLGVLQLPRQNGLPKPQRPTIAMHNVEATIDLSLPQLRNHIGALPHEDHVQTKCLHPPQPLSLDTQEARKELDVCVRVEKELPLVLADPSHHLTELTVDGRAPGRGLVAEGRLQSAEVHHPKLVLWVAEQRQRRLPVGENLGVVLGGHRQNGQDVGLL
mmetsp:Transcript_172865/g.554231  ORF Transcript_172865/g.554231 Transcript_172865/m.554231 type:complete len:218 (-) Transcript_172865:64-717(-)